MSKKLFERAQGKLFKQKLSRNNKQSSNYLDSQTVGSISNSEFNNTNQSSK